MERFTRKWRMARKLRMGLLLPVIAGLIALAAFPVGVFAEEAGEPGAAVTEAAGAETPSDPADEKGSPGGPAEKETPEASEASPSHLPIPISDLALLLIVAGVTTLAFKQIRQPLVLGYVVAGFLISTYFKLLPSVSDLENLHIWSEIGIICLMFALGLEFSFRKLANVGGTAVITSITEVCGMFLFGFVVGQVMGWGTMNSVILGGILSMSSTTIIIKAFDELNMKGKKFTEIVFGSLIVEDIVGIFMMVIMTTMSKSTGEDPAAIAVDILWLMFYLVLVLLAGIFLLPTVLRRARKLLNDETLLIVALGICFGMVLLLTEIGFSTAMGAFLAGSILAGTVYSDRIEHLVKPVKDLFGAVFFISVGMMVDPSILLKYWFPIVVVTLTTIIGKLIFSSLGVLLSGQRMKTAIRCGASLTQIGEFAFIIAALGASLGLSSEFLYPVVVSVSVVTTFTTPFFIKNADLLYKGIRKLTPKKLYEKVESYTSDENATRDKNAYWKNFMKTYFINLTVRVVILIGILEFGIFVIYPFFESFLSGVALRAAATTVVLLIMSPFVGTLLYQRRDKNFSMLLMQLKTNRLPLFVFLVLRVAISLFIIMITLNTFMGVGMAWLVIPTLLFIVLISRSDWIIGRYLQIEAHFLANFNEKTLLETSEQTGSEGPGHSWISEQLWVSEYEITHGCPVAGRALKDLGWGQAFKVDVIKIVSEKKHLNTPEGSTKLRVKDVLYLLGTKHQTELFDLAVSQKIENLVKLKEPVTLRDYIAGNENEHDEEQLFCYAVTVKRGLRFEGKNLRTSEMRSDYYCNIIGIQRNKYPIINPDVQFVINAGDQIWLLGGYKMVGRLILDGLIQTEEYLTEASEGETEPLKEETEPLKEEPEPVKQD